MQRYSNLIALVTNYASFEYLISGFKEKMKNALMSIKPQYVEEIVCNKKKFEYRKKVFKQNIENIFVYSSYPVKKIIGYFNYTGIISGEPIDIWEKTWQFSGISYIDFMKYYSNCSLAYAIKISGLVVYKQPIDPYELDATFRPPQSYFYTDTKYLI